MTLEGGPGNEQLEQKDQLKENQDLLQKEGKQIAPFVDEQEVGKTESIKPQPIPADIPMIRPESLTRSMPKPQPIPADKPMLKPIPSDTPMQKPTKSGFTARGGPETTKEGDPIKKAKEEVAKVDAIVAEVNAMKGEPVIQPKTAPQPVAPDIPMTNPNQTDISALTPVPADTPMQRPITKEPLPESKVTRDNTQDLVASTNTTKEEDGSWGEDFRDKIDNAQDGVYKGGNRESSEKVEQNMSIIPSVYRLSSVYNKKGEVSHKIEQTDDQVISSIFPGILMNKASSDAWKESWKSAEKKGTDFLDWTKEYAKELNGGKEPVNYRNTVDKALATGKVQTTYSGEGGQLEKAQAKTDFIKQKQAEAALKKKVSEETNTEIADIRAANMLKKQHDLESQKQLIADIKAKELADQKAQAEKFANAEIIEGRKLVQAPEDESVTEISRRVAGNTALTGDNVFDPSDTESIQKARDAASRTGVKKKVEDMPIDFSGNKEIVINGTTVPNELYTQFKQTNDLERFKGEIAKLKAIQDQEALANKTTQENIKLIAGEDTDKNKQNKEVVNNQ